jgi:hypothetical protein
MKDIKSLLNNLYYNTLGQIVLDLVTQIEDHDSFYEGKKRIPKKEIKQKEELLRILKPVVEIYFGDGGVDIKYTKFESFVKKYYQDILNDLK